MTTIDELIQNYNWIVFKEYSKAKPVAEDAVRVSDLNTIIDPSNKSSRELEYIWLDQGPEEATNNILRSLIGLYVLGVSDSLKKLWTDNNYQASEEDKATQLTFLKGLAEQLYKGNSDEANQLRQACKADYFKQLILYDRTKNIVYAEDESSKTDQEFGDAINLLDTIMSKLFKEMIFDKDDTNEELVA